MRLHNRIRTCCKSPYKKRTSPHTAPTQKWNRSESRKEERCFIRDRFHEDFPGGRSAAAASFNAYYNALWILLKQRTAFLYESMYAHCHHRRCHARVSTPVESVAT